MQEFEERQLNIIGLKPLENPQKVRRIA